MGWGEGIYIYTHVNTQYCFVVYVFLAGSWGNGDKGVPCTVCSRGLWVFAVPRRRFKVYFPRDLRTHFLRLLGPKTMLYKAFGRF